MPGDAGHPRTDQDDARPRATSAGTRRLLPLAALEPDPQLVADGWERRFIADKQRTAESIALYQDLGFEVRAEPVRGEELAPDCEGCILMTLLEFRTIYTRKLKDVKR